MSLFYGLILGWVGFILMLLLVIRGEILDSCYGFGVFGGFKVLFWKKRNLSF